MKIVLVKGKAGLGNRILSLLTAILFARLSKRTFYVDWSDEGYSNNGENAFPRFFEGSNIKCNLSDIYSTSVHPAIWKEHLSLSAHQLVSFQQFNKLAVKYLPWFYRKYSVNLSRLNYEEDVLVFSAYTQKINKLRSHFIGDFDFLQRKSDFDILQLILKEELKLKSDIREKINKFKNIFFIHPVLGVHIRYTDRKAPLNRYYEYIDRILKKEKIAQIFLATDSKFVQHEFQKKYNNIITTHK